MTGKATAVQLLQPGDIAHLAPHEVYGRQVVRRKADRQVVSVADCGELVTVNWRGCCRLIGGIATLYGACVYERNASVLVIGHVAVAA
jgi:hypothetical protein